MNWVGVLSAAAGLVLFGLLLYWQLIIAEGAYLGPWVVTLLYDLSAHVYERIKQYRPSDEETFLGLPLAYALAWLPAPLVLDVATGTARLPRAVLRQPSFSGRIIGVDLARRMLREAVRRTEQFADRLTFIWQDARNLPFEDGTFDAVTCLEALEFTPNPQDILTELLRVLRPGGVLLVTNRIGPEAKLMPGHTFSRAEFERLLRGFPLNKIKIRPWQVDYDLAWAIKSGPPRGGGIRPLPDILRCPACHSRLNRADRAFRCSDCTRVYRIAEDGVIEAARAIQGYR